MWAKLSGTFSKRPETPLQETFDVVDEKPSTVLSAVFDQHPNLSNFHESTEVPFPSPSPPASPSKNGRRGIFRRNPRGNGDHDSGSLSIKLPHLKKVKSSLHGSVTGEPPLPIVCLFGGKDSSSRPGNMPGVCRVTARLVDVSYAVAHAET